MRAWRTTVVGQKGLLLWVWCFRAVGHAPGVLSLPMLFQTPLLYFPGIPHLSLT
jgi:hypothetical protein